MDAESCTFALSTFDNILLEEATMMSFFALGLTMMLMGCQRFAKCIENNVLVV